MGNVPHRVFRIGTFIFICIVALLVAIGYTLQVPNYIEVPYIVSGNTSAIGIVSKNAGIVMFRYNQPHNINEGDTIATVINGNDSVYSISPIRGIVENNFLYTTGDNIVRGDTLARVISCELPNYRLSRYSKLVYIIMFRISRYALAHSFVHKLRFHRSRSPLRSLFNLCF